MKSKKNIAENLLDQVDYTFPPISKIKIITAASSLFFIAFVLNFPLFTIIDEKLKTALSRIPGCPIMVKEINFGVLLPRIELNQLNIPTRCAGNEINLSSVKLYFRGPSFSPLGIATKIETTYEGIELELFASVGPTSQLIKFDDFNIKLDKLAKVFPQVKLAGDVSINGLVEIKNAKLGKVNALIESKNFILPSQLIQGFTTPVLDEKVLSIQISQESENKMELKKFIIGDLDSPVRANFTGNIVTNKNNFLFSRLDLQGEIAFSKALEQDFGIVLDFFNAFPKKDKFFQLRVHGTVGQPIPKPL